MKILHKRWWKSKTYWFNLTSLTSITSVVLMYINEIGLDPVTAGRTAMGLSLFQSVANLILRKISSGKIGAEPVQPYKGEQV